MFIDGLRPQTKQLLDASVGGKIKLKTPEEATELIENMSANDHAILRDITHQPIKKNLLELTSHDALLVTGCTMCGEAHEIGQCIPTDDNTQEIHFIGNQQRQGYTQGGFPGFQQGLYNQQG
ncbi:uncharacterized protein [Glycine max]|uniref:uncharacterized protein n=1 Tax=Glycine max TaxID=3847 RepID=UPI0003DE823B|nr:uncharacterized protein LOC102661085 [Glycine max]|eukprot:XP_006590059.1 uncharacterized protein LOC102661085 [Glycine max]